MLLTVAGLLATGALAARAQTAPTVPTVPDPTSTTTTSSTTTTAPEAPPDEPDEGDGDGDADGDGGGEDGGNRDDDQAPPGDGSGAPGAGEPGSPGEAPHDAGDAPEDPAVDRHVPPDVQAVIDSVPRTRANNTSRLLERLQPLRDLGLTEQDAAVLGMGRFPVAGYASFVDDWWFPRFVPELHLHEGTDIFAEAGTPVRAAFEGIIRHVEGPIGGLAVYIDLPGGGYVYMSHLDSFASGILTGETVPVGKVVGFVGDSGNAKGGKPHVHFELHLPPEPVAAGSPVPPVNPKPHLDAWLEEAIADVPRVVAAYQASRPRALLTTGLTRRLGDGSGTFAAPSHPPRSQLLWASSANPAGGALAIAEARAAALARRVDWR